MKNNVKNVYRPVDFQLGDIVHWVGNLVTGLGFIYEYELYDDGDVRNCKVRFFDGNYVRHNGENYNWITLDDKDVRSGRLTKSTASEAETEIARDYMFKKLTHEGRGRFMNAADLNSFLVELNALCEKYRIVFDCLGSLPGYNMTKIDKKPVFVGEIGKNGAYMTAMYRVE